MIRDVDIVNSPEWPPRSQPFWRFSPGAHLSPGEECYMFISQQRRSANPATESSGGRCRSSGRLS